MSKYCVFSVQELEKILQLLEDYNYCTRLLLVNPRDKKASKLLDSSYMLLLTLVNPKQRLLFDNVECNNFKNTEV